MNWLDVLKTVSTSTVLVGALCFLAKALMNSLLSKDLEKFKAELSAKNSEMIERIKAELSAKNAEALEPLKAELQQATQKISVQFSSLHAKRLEIIAEAYNHVVALHILCLGLSVELFNRDIRKKAYATSEDPESDPCDIKEGIHTFNKAEISKLTELKNGYARLMVSFWPKEIYFSTALSYKLSLFAVKAALLDNEYEKIALNNTMNTEDHQEPYKNWDELITGIVELKNEIGTEFRELLGVVDKAQS